MGLPGTEAFLFPRFLFVGNRLQPPLPSLSPKGQIRTVANQGREGMQRQGRKPPEARSKKPKKLIRRPPEARLKECRLCTHPDPYQPFSHCYKTH